MPVSTPRTRAAKRALIAAQAESPDFRIRWGRVAASILALVSSIGLLLMFCYMAGEFMDRL